MEPRSFPMRFRWSIRRGASSTAGSAPRLANSFGWRLGSVPWSYPRIPARARSWVFSSAKDTCGKRLKLWNWRSTISNLKQLRKKTEHHIPVNSLPEEDQFTRLCTERKHFIDTLKMIAYRAESSMASLLREHMARGGDDARALLRQIFQTEADLTPDLAANTLTVRLHHLTQAAHDQA